MRALVTGSRWWTDCRSVFHALDERRDQITHIIHGGSRGVDRCAKRWAYHNRLPESEFLPNYRAYGSKAAPLMRNQRMIDEGRPDLIIAFPGGNGTADMIGRAQRARIPVLRIVF